MTGLGGQLQASTNSATGREQNSLRQVGRVETRAPQQLQQLVVSLRSQTLKQVIDLSDQKQLELTLVAS